MSPAPLHASERQKLYVGIQQLPHGRDLPLPSYATAFSAGLDLYAAIEGEIILAPQEWQSIPTGIAIALPHGFEAQIRSRSGLSARHGIVVLNAPGTIDADYRGEIKVVLMNHGRQHFKVTRGMRLSQMIIAPVARITWDVQTSLDQTCRGDGGFGSTGLTLG